MKQLLTAVAVLTLATACSTNPVGPSLPPQIDDPSSSSSPLTLSGSVSQMTDDGSVPVQGATVELMQNSGLSTGRSRAQHGARPSDLVVLLTALTDGSGNYEFAGIGAGTYALRISKAGFKTYDSGEISVSSDTQFNVELTLDPNASTERAKRARR
jgi:hypothetical protein